MYLVASFKIFLFIYNLAIYNLLLIQPLSSCVNCRKYQTHVAEKEVEKKCHQLPQMILGCVSLKEDSSSEARTICILLFEAVIANKYRAVQLCLNHLF